MTRAVWGDHFFGVCDSDECCPPHPAYDDFVDMETNETLTFELIKLQCDGETSCDVEYIPYDIPCEGCLADYMQVFYDCTPYSTSNPVGFSAKISSNIRLQSAALVLFDDVISNFGGHYSNETYTFTCPVYGVYVFTMTIIQWDFYIIQADLYRNSDFLIRAWADDEGYMDSSTATVFIECQKGDQVYVSVAYGGYFDGGLTSCHFTGYLVHRY